MGNLTNRDQWAGRERLRFVERHAWWRATVNRKDLQEVFGISAAQASADLQAYLESNPGALVYNLRQKRYEGAPDMTCVFDLPRFEDAISMFLGVGSPGPNSSSGGSHSKAEHLPLPIREPGPQVARRMFLAVDRGAKIVIRYLSLASGSQQRREIAPHAFAHDGYRWHARAWCFQNNEYRDFVLSRMEEAEWPGENWNPAQPDDAWNRLIALRFRPARGLSEPQKQAVIHDYGLQGERITITVREALVPYLQAHLRIANEMNVPPHLEADEP